MAGACDGAAGAVTMDPRTSPSVDARTALSAQANDHLQLPGNPRSAWNF